MYFAASLLWSFIVGGRRQQTSNVLIEIIVNSNLRKEENYIYTKGVYLWQCFVGGGAFHEVLFSFENKSIRDLWEARALILLRSHLNGRDGQKAGRLFISGCIDRDGGWQIEHNSRILLILLSLFSKEEWRCVLFQFMKCRTLFQIYYWSLSESAMAHLCAAKIQIFGVRL